MDCLFCKILAGDIPATVVYKSETTLAFRDIAPQAPEHILVIHKDHYPSIHDVPAEVKAAYFGELMATVHAVVEQENLTENGYRVVMNSGEDAQQAVPHIHMHILAGRSLQWPPG